MQPVVTAEGIYTLEVTDGDGCVAKVTDSNGCIVQQP